MSRYITVRGLIDLLNEMIEKEEISKEDAITDAVIVGDARLLGGTEYYNIDKEIPDESLFLKFSLKESSGYDLGVSFYSVETDKEEENV